MLPQPNRKREGKVPRGGRLITQKWNAACRPELRGAGQLMPKGAGFSLGRQKELRRWTEVMVAQHGKDT